MGYVYVCIVYVPYVCYMSIVYLKRERKICYVSTYVLCKHLPYLPYSYIIHLLRYVYMLYIWCIYVYTLSYIYYRYGEIKGITSLTGGDIVIEYNTHQQADTAKNIGSVYENIPFKLEWQTTPAPVPVSVSGSSAETQNKNEVSGSDHNVSDNNSMDVLRVWGVYIKCVLISDGITNSNGDNTGKYINIHVYHFCIPIYMY